MFFAAFGLAVSFFLHILACCMNFNAVGVRFGVYCAWSSEFGEFFSQNSSPKRFSTVETSKSFSLRSLMLRFSSPQWYRKGRCTHQHRQMCFNERENMNLHERKCALNDKLSENAFFFRPREISCACDGLLINSTRENGEIESPFAVTAFYLTRPIFDFHRSNSFSVFLVDKDSRWGIFPFRLELS